MRLISREELKAKIDRGDDFMLVMCLEKTAFEAKRIPGSICMPRPEGYEDMCKPEDDIVVYCSGPDCHSSINTFRILDESGYKKVRRYAGGLEDWDEAGYPLEGEQAD
jgi:rhodanese-related sulfurtransferase